MKIPLNINTKDIFVDCVPGELLVNILRREELFSVKDTDTTGLSGSSTILLDKKPVPACLIPVAAARDSNIITLEHFSTTPVCKIILAELERAKVRLCGICNPGKIFTAVDIILYNYRPSIPEVLAQLQEFTCCCVDTALLTHVIIKAAHVYRQSTGVQNAKKR